MRFGLNDDIRRLPTVLNVPTGRAGGTASVLIPSKQRLFTIYLTVSGVVPGTTPVAVTNINQVISKIRPVFNGKPLYELTPDEIKKVNSYRDAKLNGNDPLTLVIHLRQPEYTFANDQFATSWSLHQVAQVQLDLDVIAGLDNVKITGFTAGDDGLDLKGAPLPIGDIRRYNIDTFPVSITSDGVKVTTLTPRRNTKHWFFETDKIASIRVQAAGRNIIEETTVEELANMLYVHGYTVPSGWTVVPFDILGHLGLGVSGEFLRANDLTVFLKMKDGPPDAIRLLNEYVGPGAE